MSKRVKLSIDPYKFQYETCFTFLCVVYRVRQMRKCLNKDILKKICGMVDIDLSKGMEIDDYMYELVKSDGFIYWGGLTNPTKRPCHSCLRPTIDWKEITCAKHQTVLHCKCIKLGLHHSVFLECIPKGFKINGFE